MRRILMILTVALVMAAMMAVGAGPASAQTLPTLPSGDSIGSFITGTTNSALDFGNNPTSGSATKFANQLAGGITGLFGLGSG